MPAFSSLTYSKQEKKGIEFEQINNVFVHIDDFEKAQKLADTFTPDRLHKTLDHVVREYAPVIHHFPSGVHWSLMQAEYATDTVKRRMKE